MSSAGTAEPETTAWHALPVEEIARQLGVDPARGLDTAEAATRLQVHGPTACRWARGRARCCGSSRSCTIS